ncbi:aminodeoxychorismate synthase component I [Pseudobacteroides cellulosolvens]|uniref:Aminodeoxychorismate synthase n=1 Tax=Pseudobacteroides cellulosolvens ATCC 35603 = DSM 2933 TaxID=398512 RepID=A0A0L6JJ92_9FIRM|nr:aminodeoxychorismate synthase component I [Pseudobacteroides cellulosolvens]KNY25946.1 Aminodeoxychorismate synthase [Pseudobacteroides cellulosolvens ATCC 35603 = DSM 2933]
MKCSGMENWILKANYFGKNNIPFVFLVDFNLSKPFIEKVSDIDSSQMLYNFNGYTNCNYKDNTFNKSICIKSYTLDFNKYEEAFKYIHQNQYSGNSYLANLTFPIRVELGASLKEIFYCSVAKYKLWYQDEFVVFSPEIFVRIDKGLISSYPMKGTIDASIKNAEEIILANEKEAAEHATIVDLIRNDLNMVASNVYVEKYRYIDRIISNQRNLLQVSSKIVGKLSEDYNERLGDIIVKLLPAGSITGAPKKKTVEIIKHAEKYDRGYYCGICGYFDGYRLDSGVMIRFIENMDGEYYYKSGGGITIYSDVESEYRELNNKIYVPVG